MLQAKYRHDYRAPDYTITDIHLDFDLEAEDTTVTTASTVVRQGQAGAPLLLNGENLRLLSLRVDDQEWTHYRLDAPGLDIEQLPATFTLIIKTLIHPANNTALEELYLSGDALCTQCEAEGFRHITFIWTVRMFWPGSPRVFWRISNAIRSCSPTITVLIAGITAIAGIGTPWKILSKTVLPLCAGDGEILMYCATALPPVPRGGHAGAVCRSR